MKRILPLLLAVAALSARANVLVYEGFHPADYNNVGDNTQMTPSGANVTGDYTVGLATGAWQMNGSMPKVYGTSRGLALPSAMTDAGFAVLGGSIGLNPGDDNKALRSTSHGLVAGTLNVSSGTLYVRALLNLDSKAATKLVAGEALAQKDGGYFGFGLTTGTTDYYLLTRSAASIAFVVWKNASDQYVLSLAHTTASGTAFTSYPLLTGITLGTTYLCYAEIQVGAGSDGKEILRAGAMATDAFTTDTPWAAIGGESDSVQVDLMTDSSYPTRIGLAGPYGTKEGSNGYFRADEFVVGTELPDILLATTTKPKLSNGALSLANGTYAVSASLANSAADVSYVLSNGTIATTNAIATYADGDTVAGTFAAPTDDTTYEVLLVAENAGGETGELSLGTIYGGLLSLGAATDANETGLVAGGVTVSRAAADPLPLTVNYSISGSAGTEGTTWAAPVAVTIPAGSASAVLPVTPVSDPDVTEDVTITVSLAAGNYGLPSANAATLTLVNHRAAVPADFAKKITLTPSETALAKIGETAWADFPVLVRLPAEASALLQSADGTDLFFTDENDASLPFEVETFDPAGTTFVWVKVPSLSAATELTVWFGGASNQDNDPTAVWSRYVGVWHFDADAAGTTTVADATGHALDATTAGDLTAVDGPFGDRCLRSSASTSAPDFEAGFAVGATFTASGWFKAPEMTSSEYVSPAKKKGSTWNAANGWYLEMPQNTGKLQIILTGSTPSTTLSDVRSNWHYFEVVSGGGSVKVYLDGATSPKINSTYAIVANSERYSIQAPKMLCDEYRIRKGSASAAETALEYATMADAAFFDLGAIESVDDTAQVFETPTVVRNADGTYTVTVVLSENSGDVGAIYDAGATAVTNLLATAAAPGTFADTPANLAADTTYAFAAYGKNANGTEVVAKGGVFYNGDLSIAALSNAVERGAVPGAFRVSRADAAHDLVVNLSIAGTAVAGQTYEALPTTVTIPAGATFVDVRVRPILDPETVQDATVEVSIAAGLYGVAQDAGTATVTVENLVAPTGYNVWIATSDGLASVDDNWSLGREPVESDNILFDGEFSTANCEWDTNATATVASWTQTNGYTGTVTVDTVFPGKGNFQCLTVTGPMAVMSGAITHPQSRTMGDNHPATWDWVGDLLANETYRLRLAVGSLTVGAGGLLDAKGKGYRVTNNSAMVNASHGGRASQAAQRCYGDPKEPIHIGLADKTQGNGGYYNGKGGGAIYVTSPGPVVVDGTIRADSDREGTGCCGAAGSVYLNASSVSGTGTISAYGPGSGDGNYKGTGGRVAIVTDDPVDRATFASITADSARLHSANRRATRFGGAGTVFFKDRTRPNGLLVVGSSTDALSPNWDQIYATASVTTDGDWTFDAVEFGRFGFLVVPAGTTLMLPNGLACCTGVVSSASAVGGIRYEGGTLDIGAGPQTIAGNWMFCAWSNYVFHADVTVKNGGLIGVHPINERVESGTTLPAFVYCDLAVDGDLTVESTGAIVATDCGFRKNRSDTHNGVLGFHSHGGRTLNWGRPDALFYEGYDSIFSPRLPGCSVPVPDGQTAGRCGGAVKLVVSGTLTLDGPANANGFPESHNGGGNASGGAGGSLDFTAGRLAGSGSITADGGSYAWQRGPGGRVAVKLTGAGAGFADFAGDIRASGRAVSPGGAEDASAGTVYLQTAADGDKGGTILVAMREGNRFAGNTNTTEMVSLGYGGDDVLDYKRVSYVVSDYGRAAANTNFTAKTVTIADTDSGIDLEGHELTVRDFFYVETEGETIRLRHLPPGTYGWSALEGYAWAADSSPEKTGRIVVHGAATMLIVK